MFRLYTGKLSRIGQLESDSKHALIGQVSDKITNINTLFAFGARKRELDTLHHQMTTDYMPKQQRYYRFLLMIGIIGGVF